MTRVASGREVIKGREDIVPWVLLALCHEFSSQRSDLFEDWGKIPVSSLLQ